MGADHQRDEHQTRLALDGPRYSLRVDMRRLIGMTGQNAKNRTPHIIRAVYPLDALSASVQGGSNARQAVDCRCCRRDPHDSHSAIRTSRRALLTPELPFAVPSFGGFRPQRISGLRVRRITVGGTHQDKHRAIREFRHLHGRPTGAAKGRPQCASSSAPSAATRCSSKAVHGVK